MRMFFGATILTGIVVVTVDRLDVRITIEFNKGKRIKMMEGTTLKFVKQMPYTEGKRSVTNLTFCDVKIHDGMNLMIKVYIIFLYFLVENIKSFL